MPISLAIKKYGKEKFSIQELCVCQNQSELDKQEKFWGEKLNTMAPNGYNLRLGSGRGAMSEETKKKIGEANRGKVVSQETRRKQSAAHVGCKMKEETKRKLSERNKGKKPSLNTRAGASKKNSKSYILLDKNGKTVYIVNMRKFCEAHGLQKSNMSSLVNGKIKSYRGWKLP